MSKKIIIGNWKMNPQNEKEAIIIAKMTDKNGVIIAPPFVFIPAIKKVIKRAKLGSQNISPEAKGSFTGEVSPSMLKNFGVKYAIVGHSERRSPLAGGGESDEMINKKIKAALKN